MANIYENKLPDPVSPMGLAASAAGQGLFQFGESFIKVTDRNAELEAEELKRMALAEVDRMKTSFNQGMAIEQMDLDKATLEEKKRATKVAERQADTEERRLQEESEARIVQMEQDAALRERALDDAMTRHHDSMTNEEKRIELSESDLRLRQSIAEKNWELAEKELAFQKEKFGWTKDIDELKLGQADKSLAENKRQFDANIKIREQELAITEERLALDTTSAEDRKALEEKRIAIQGELADLEDRRVTLAEEKSLQDELYRDIMTELEQDKAALAERGMEVKEGMLTIAQGESERDKWVFKEVPIYEQVLTSGEAGSSTAEYDEQIVGYKIVAINVDDPELMDVREWTEDGWSNGTPDMDQETLSAISDVQKIMNDRDVSAADAIALAKKANPDWKGWEGFEKRILLDVVTREAQVNVGEQDTAGIITPDSGAISTEEEEAIEGILNPAPKGRVRGSGAAILQ
tara:strand:- start:1542 stop:2936 length:1395 start_codon:yes stop_codon:yes gene_type:complete